MEPKKKPRKPKKLTKKLVDSLRTRELKGIRLYDSELPGFFVTCFPSGRRSFGVRYNIGTSRRWITLGPFGPLTVETAREAARQVLSEATLGGDPALDRKRKREEVMPTFEKWAADYLAECQRTRKRPDAIAWNLKWAVAAWRNRRLDTIDPEDVSLLFLSFRKTPIGANRFLATVKACFNDAVKKKLLRESPAAGIEGNRENPPRFRVLSDEELGQLWSAIEAEEDPHVRGAFRLLLETGARLSEVLGAKWENVDLEAPRWRLPDPKSGTSQMIVLADSTAEWLGKLPRVEDCPFVFPGIDPEKHRHDLKKPWERIRKAANLGDATIHDIRRTFGKLVAREAGLHMASAVLRHSDVRITASTYAPMAEAEMRVAVSKVLPFLRRTVA
jgi:integrase